MKKFLVIALAIGTIVGCKKKDDSTTQSEVTSANIAGKYKVTDETTSTNGVTINTFNTVTDCQRKSSLTLGATGSLAIADSCGLGLSGSSYTYTLSNSMLILNLGGSVSRELGKVTSLTSTGMTLTETDTTSTNPLTILVISTNYTKQ